MTNKFSKKLKKIMYEKGFTQKDLAEKLGVSQAFISSWQVGKRNPKLSSIKKISEALNVPVDYFFESSENKDSKKDIKILQLEKENLRLQKEISDLKNEILEMKLQMKK